MEVVSVEPGSSEIIVEISGVEGTASDLDVALEQLRDKVTNEIHTIVVIRRIREPGGPKPRTLRVKLNIASEIGPLAAFLNPKTKVLIVTVGLVASKLSEKPPAAAAAPAAAADSDGESMHSATSSNLAVSSAENTLDEEVEPTPNTPSHSDAEPLGVEDSQADVAALQDTAEVEPEPEAAVEAAPQVEPEAEAEAAAAAAAGERKRRKKKKKRKKGGAGGAAGGDGAAEEEEGGGGEDEGGSAGAGEEAAAAEGDILAPAAAGAETPKNSATSGADASEEAPAAVAAEEEVKKAGEGPQQDPEQEQPEAVVQQEAIQGVVDLKKAVERRALTGPYVTGRLAKATSKGKGEDTWLLRPEMGWALEGEPGETGLTAWGIFDGHGGKQAATYASNSLVKDAMAIAAEGRVAEAGSAATRPPVTASDLPKLEGAAAEDLLEWRLQAELARRLPGALSAAFIACNSEAQRRFKAGGTTATVAVAVGWELIVANVGDSLAFLDTGAEVLQVSGNHRLEANKSEVERIEASGGEVASSTVDGRPAGPIRVWPGGLAMARSLGDVDAGERVKGEPDICQVTIPAEGARLIIGSDGLWDAMNPKTAAHQARDLHAEAAAHKLLASAIKIDKLKDDVTVLVVDFSPHEGDRRIPLALQRGAGAGGKKGGGAGGVHSAKVWHPLRDDEAHREDYVAAGAARRREVLAAAAAAEEERQLEEARRREKEAEAAARRALEAGAMQAGSGLYAELAHLKLSAEEIEGAFSRESSRREEEEREAQREVEEGDWEPVPSGRHTADAGVDEDSEEEGAEQHKKRGKRGGRKRRAKREAAEKRQLQGKGGERAKQQQQQPLVRSFSGEAPAGAAVASSDKTQHQQPEQQRPPRPLRQPRADSSERTAGARGSQGQSQKQSRSEGGQQEGGGKRGGGSRRSPGGGRGGRGGSSQSPGIEGAAAAAAAAAAASLANVKPPASSAAAGRQGAPAAESGGARPAILVFEGRGKSGEGPRGDQQGGAPPPPRDGRGRGDRGRGRRGGGRGCEGASS